MIEKNNDVLTITRVFNAPRQVVWNYWKDPEYFKKWWGPKEFTCPFSEIDFRVGGRCLSAMRSREGQEFWSTGTYKDIAPFEKIVVTDSFADKEGNIVPSTYYGMEGFPLELEVTVMFEDVGGKTKMTLMHKGVGNLDAKMRKEMEQGWNESFDKMAQDLSHFIK